MANKALAKRQKMTIRVEPSQRAGKARNASVPPAGKRVATSGRSDGQARPTLRDRLLKRFS